MVHITKHALPTGMNLWGFHRHEGNTQCIDSVFVRTSP